MKNKIYLQFLRWIIGFAEIVDGLIIIFSFGFYSKNGLAIKASLFYSAERYRILKEK